MRLLNTLTRSACLIILLTVISLPVLSAENNAGKILYEQNCVQCHQADIFLRENRIVNSLEELNRRVRQCELANELTWFDEEVDAVIHYLNDNFYKFETGK